MPNGRSSDIFICCFYEGYGVFLASELCVYECYKFQQYPVQPVNTEEVRALLCYVYLECGPSHTAQLFFQNILLLLTQDAPGLS